MAGDLVAIEEGVNKVLSQGEREVGNIHQSEVGSLLTLGHQFSSDETTVGSHQKKKTHLTRFHDENSGSRYQKKSSDLKENPRLPLVNTSRSNHTGQLSAFPRVKRITQREKIRKMAYFQGTSDLRFFRAPSFATQEVSKPVPQQTVKPKPEVRKVKDQTQSLGLNIMRLR